MAIQSLTKHELLRLLRCAKAKKERDWLMILVSFSHGLRASEVTGFSRDAVSDGFLTVKRLKGSLPTTQPLLEHSNELLNERQALIDYAEKSSFSKPVFPVHRSTFWRIVQRYAKQAGLPAHKRHPHVLKHTIAMRIIHSTGIENTRQWLGHRSIASTGEYLRVTDSDAAKAVTKALRGRRRV